MGRAEAGSTKALANAVKAKGLGRLRWYCQICEKQCRDENGFQAHTRSEPHMRKMLLVGPKAGATIAGFSNQFQKEFVTLLRTRHQTMRVRANAVYNEYIQDKHHVHMNATRWVTLNGFIMTIGKAGIVKVDEDEKGLWITWVDNSPKTLAKQAALQKKDRAQMDGEERERAELEQQIARAKALEGEKREEDTGLQKKEGEKIVLSFGAPAHGPSIKAEDGTPEAGPSRISPPSTSTDVTGTNGTTTSTSEGVKAEDSKPAMTFGTFGSTPAQPTSIAINPLKRPAPVNVFKSAKTPKTDPSTDSGSSKKSYMSEAERLMKEDQARKSMKPGGYQGAGPRRTGDGGRRFVLQ